jgi:hypothetical protein
MACLQMARSATGTGWTSVFFALSNSCKRCEGLEAVLALDSSNGCFGPVVSLDVSGSAKLSHKRSFLEHASSALFSAATNLVQN